MAHHITDALSQQSILVSNLRTSKAYPHPADEVDLLETHISYVLLAGDFAYKIKKSVDFGFLDFHTLDKRHFFCLEELRLNRRQANGIYLDVVPITGSIAHPSIGGTGDAMEFAVKMRRFPQGALLDQISARGELSPSLIDRLAACAAEFHAHIAVADAGISFGSTAEIQKYTLDNIETIASFFKNEPAHLLLAEYTAWIEQQHRQLADTFNARRQQGFVRECHGDLHLRNIIFLDDRLWFFDCIEFNDALRWIDVLNELAFLAMDIEAAGKPALARRLLNTYLEITGDYAGLPVWRYYFSYRAMVRAKIALLRLQQETTHAEITKLRDTACRYVTLAHRHCKPTFSGIVITHGFSGCGKTRLSQEFLELTGAIRLRSDVERKRMLGISAWQPAGDAVESGLYAQNLTTATYKRLLELTEAIVDAGHVALVDATFLTRRHRDWFRQAAQRKGVPFAVIDFQAERATLEQRIEFRRRQGHDASDADLTVLAHQLSTHEALQQDECPDVFTYNAERPLEYARQEETWAPLLYRLTKTTQGH